MENFFIIPVAIIVLIGLTDLPRRSPDTLAPIQLITLTGTMALALLQIASAVAALYWWLVLPAGLAAGLALVYLIAAALAVITTCGVFSRGVLRRRRPASSDVVSWMQAEVDALEPLVRGGHGINAIHLYRGSANGTEVEAFQTPDGAGIRVGGGLPKKLSQFKRHSSGGSDRVRTLIRFMVLHELGHLLNGDHLAYQLTRATLLAQLWYLAPLAGFGVVAVAVMTGGAHPEEVGAIIGMGLLLFSTTMIVSFQRTIASDFASARERLADWRATITLTNAETERLLHAAPDDCSFLEKALSALKPPPMMPALTALLTLTWPQAGPIGARVRELITGEFQGRHRPFLWSALAGLNMGGLVVLTVSLSAPLVHSWGKRAVEHAALATSMVLVTVSSAMLIGRADPTDPVNNGHRLWDRLVAAAATYAACYVSSVISGYLFLHAAPPLRPLQHVPSGAVVVIPMIFMGGMTFMVGVATDRGPAWLRLRGDLTMNVVPFLLGLSVFFPLSLLLESSVSSK
ncbi:MAG TPA: hypothetical protein VF618_12370 [Thermoanaerobaculia bacterium]